MMTQVSVRTTQPSEFVDITDIINSIVKKSEIKKGVVTIFIPHTTAGITINEHADPSVASDMLRTLDQIVPWKNNYSHAEGNSAAHIKASLMGSSVRVIVENGSLVLGTWQGIFFCEFDGPRSRKALVKVMSSDL